MTENNEKLEDIHMGKPDYWLCNKELQAASSSVLTSKPTLSPSSTHTQQSSKK